jgi:hypothetical protein
MATGTRVAQRMRDTYEGGEPMSKPTAVSKKALFVVLALVAAPTGVAMAGYKYSLPVSISDTSKTAYGVMGSARNSSDTAQYIGCNVSTFAGSAPSTTCSAVNSAGTSRSCTTYDAKIVEVAKAISGESYIRFYWNTSGECTQLTVAHFSQYEPKKP